MSAATVKPSATAKPSPRQVYFIARLALRYAGHELPETRADAHELIQTLTAALDARPTTDASHGDIPF
jgi:hypothetical protein